MNEFESLPDLNPHPFYMQKALEQARIAESMDEVPIGAVVVHQGRLIGAAHNQRQMLHDPTAHAEMLAITQAAEALGDWRLLDCALYVTLEPCPMCAGAIVNARIPWVIFGATDPKAGAVNSLFQLLNDKRLNHRCEVVSGVMDIECGEILTPSSVASGKWARNSRLAKPRPDPRTVWKNEVADSPLDLVSFKVWESRLVTTTG